MSEAPETTVARIEERVIALTDSVKEFHAAILHKNATQDEVLDKHAAKITIHGTYWKIVGWSLGAGVTLAAAALGSLLLLK